VEVPSISFPSAARPRILHQSGMGYLAFLGEVLFFAWDFVISTRRRSRDRSMTRRSSRATETLSSSCSRVSSGELTGCLDLAIRRKNTKGAQASQHFSALSKLKACYFPPK
jgi:hypothetical protein